MPLSAQRPPCLHVPYLEGGNVAEIAWEDTNEPSYQLEAVFDESFETAMTGEQWLTIDCKDGLFKELELNTWAEFAAKPPTGLTWRTMDCLATAWVELDARQKNWRELALTPYSPVWFVGAGTLTDGLDKEGYDWAKLEVAASTWADAESKNLTWKALHSLLNSHMSWNSFDARCLTWAETAAFQHTWDDIEQLLGDCEPHRCCTLPIIPGAQSAMFRLRTASAPQTAQAYITTTRQLVWAKEAREYNLEQGDEVFQFAAQSARDISGAQWLFSAQQEKAAVAGASITPSHLFSKLLSSSQQPENILRLQSAPPFSNEFLWSGALGRIHVPITKPGNTGVTLKRSNENDERIL